MWLSILFPILACLCVVAIVGWVVSRRRRWGVFGAGRPKPPKDRRGPDTLARRA